MKRSIMILGAIMVLCNVSNMLAQEKTMRSVLIDAGKWYYMNCDTICSLGHFYTKMGMGAFVLKNGVLTESKECVPYYLSDEADVEFDESKVGKKENGKYLIRKTLETEKFYVYEILELNNKEFIMIDVNDSSNRQRYVSKEF